MRKLFFFIILIGNLSFAFTQTYDTIIQTPIYTSYFSYKQKVPAVIKYKLYKGGGKCDRKNFYFTNDIKKLRTATNKDYSGSGYDKGHMVNAEDFAYNCKLDKITFRYYNCVPQTAAMNRGIWKSYETKIRKLSQTDSLLIIIVNVFDNKYMGNKVGVPSHCIKAVYSLSAKKVVMAFAVSNSLDPVLEDTTVAVINKKYKINIDKFRN